mmetsp:Transcript_17623/g.33467  ORF Transcript_17623/g.33467 Transcript_17623/m.33467 type:complete len:90 (+) Transcript_17623:318-587(+)
MHTRTVVTFDKSQHIRIRFGRDDAPHSPMIRSTWPHSNPLRKLNRSLRTTSNYCKPHPHGERLRLCAWEHARALSCIVTMMHFFLATMP